MLDRLLGLITPDFDYHILNKHACPVIFPESANLMCVSLRRPVDSPTQRLLASLVPLPFQTHIFQLEGSYPL